MKKNYSLLILAFLCAVVSNFGQTIISEDFRSGSLPTGWSDSNITYTTSAGGYARFVGSASYIESPVIDLSGYTGVTLTFDVAKLGSGGDGPLTVEVSDDGGATWTAQTYNSPTPTSSTYETSGPTSITATGNNIKIRFLRTASSSQKRFRDFLLEGTATSCTDAMAFVNIQSPTASPQNITTGDTFNVYTHATEPGVTDASATAAGPGVEAWIGYSSTNSDPSGSGWTWIAATYTSDVGGNDEHVAEIGSGLAAGTYYYASRYSLNNCDYTYGGTSGNWTAIADNVELIVTDPPLADVVITEIMYNSTGTDDEWIEICNISGSTQNLSNYDIEVNGSVEFTFANGITITDGTCITIGLGDGGGAFNPLCNFTPTYTNGSGTGTLGNSSGTIELVAPSTTVVDLVFYDDGDGADGDGNSLHVIDATLDNSNTGSNWQEVSYGGSHDVNSLISPCVPLIPEINVRGDVGTMPSIASGSTATTYLNNTRFTPQFIGSSEARSYLIENLGGVNLNISSVTVSGTNPGDFMVSIDPTGAVTPGQNPAEELEVTFSPLASGIRTAIITINNDDPDESAYTFAVRGDGNCVSSSTTISPSSGPANTIVTVSGTDYGVSTTASFNGTAAASINVISATEMELTVPSGATTGNLEIIDDLGCTSIVPFTIIDNQISSCQGVGNLSDLVMTEITDATTGSLTYIEIYNGTGASVNLGSYSLEILQNGATNVPDNSSYSLSLNAISLANNAVYVVAIGTVASPDYTDPGADTCTINISGSPVGNGELADQTTTQSGVNMKPDKHDVIRLLNAGAVIDEFGVHEDENWMLSTTITGDRGFNFRRLNTSTMPNSTFNLSDWNVIDWVGSGLTSCSNNDYSDIGFFDYSSGAPPNITTQPIPQAANCNLTASFTVAGQETYTGAGNYTPGLTYQWFYAAPGATGWIAVTNTAPYSGADTATLNISSTLNLVDYQYYCQIRENDASCYTASNTVKIDITQAEWDGTQWINGINPDIYTIVVINGDYETVTDGNFSACQLIINAGHKLTVGDATYVEVENNTIVNGDLWVETHGAFVQKVDLPNGFTLNAGGGALVNKTTTVLNNWYDYTYWSSPIVDETIGDALDIAPANRRFWFNAQNYWDEYLDSTDNVTLGSDDIDDNGNDWQPAVAGDIMTPGVGYAATVLPLGFTPRAYQATFEGAFNNGVITTPIYVNGLATDNDWNLIGNPYPCAIDFDNLHSLNSTVIDGAAYLWSHASPPERDNDGNEVLNFNADDYAIITIGSGNTAGSGPLSDNTIPNADNTIPSGQGFFVRGLASQNITFNNRMRKADVVSNNQFFRSSSERTSSANRLWINLESDNGVFNQILVAYVDGATNDFDGFSYDAPRNLSSGTASVIYTEIEGDHRKFAIQGKESSNLNIDEIIPFGFYTNIEIATIYSFSIPQFEGTFFENNTVYVHDKYLNIYHDLDASTYTFTSETGEFNDRFEIVFNPDLLSIDENELYDALSIIELQNGIVKFTVSNNLEIKNVKIYDTLGRILYNLEGSSNTEVYNLDNLSQAAYVAQVTLSNDMVITKKAIKRN